MYFIVNETRKIVLGVLQLHIYKCEYIVFFLAKQKLSKSCKQLITMNKT